MQEIAKAIRKATGTSEEKALVAARRLMRFAPVARPERKIAPSREGLQDFAHGLADTLKALDALSPEAHAELNYRPSALREFKGSLRAWRLMADWAVKRVKPKRGRPTKARLSLAQKIALEVATHYCVLAGEKKLRASHQFVALLSEVYDTLGVDAKALSQAKTLAGK